MTGDGVVRESKVKSADVTEFSLSSTAGSGVHSPPSLGEVKPKNASASVGKDSFGEIRPGHDG